MSILTGQRAGSHSRHRPQAAVALTQSAADTVWQASRHYRASTGPVLGQDTRVRVVSTDDAQPATPEECDRIVQEIRYRDIRVPSQLDISWARRLENSWLSVRALLRGTRDFFLSIPRAVNTARRMSLSDWRETLGGWWVTIKHEAKHYWVGFKIFGLEVSVASRLVWKQLQGHALTRRERKQLTRTTADIFRMVPFTLFIIVPFAELLLPVALRLFPNMLPSTFQTQLKQEEDMKKLLKLKTELAKFLQQTVGELAKDVRNRKSGAMADDAKALFSFLQDVRAGRDVDNRDIVKFAALFNDELTLENLDRVHLVTLCTFLGLNHLGTEQFLRTRLRTHLNEIKADDIEIQQEGVHELTDDELRGACRARGMPAPFGEGSTSFMRRQLSDWIELSLDKNIPQSLLLLSRAFKIRTAGVAKAKKDAKAETVEALKETFNLLPGETIEDVEMESFKSTTSLEKRLEYLRRVEQDIKEENASAKELEAARAELESSQARLDMVEAKARATAKAVIRKATAFALKDAIDRGSVKVAGGESAEEATYKSAAAKEERMSNVISTLVALASVSGVSQERALFLEVAKDEVHSMLTKLNDPGGSYLLFTGEGVESVRPATEQQPHYSDAIVDQVSKSVQNILFRIEADLDRADLKIGGKLHLLDTDNDGMITRSELQDALKFLQSELTDDEMQSLQDMLGDSDSISVQELEELKSRIRDAKLTGC